MPENDEVMYFLRMVLLYDQVITHSKSSVSKGHAALALFKFMEEEGKEIMIEDTRFRLLLVSKAGMLEKEISENEDLKNIVVALLGEGIITETPADAAAETPTDAPADAAAETPADATTDAAAETPADAAAETPTDATTDAAAETPADAPAPADLS